MTPTRALIEAAERAQLLLRGLTVGTVMERGIEAINAAGLNPYCMNEGRATGSERISTDWLDLAISSAKAAEEGVETTYDAQFFTKYGDDGDWITDYPAMNLEQAKERAKSLSHRWKCRVVEKNTYTTVVEVREKEGL